MTVLRGSLIAVAVCLGVIVAWQALTPIAPIAELPAPAADMHIAVVPVLPSYAVPSPADFAVINAHALFDPARGPATEPEHGTALSLQPPDLSLVGVAIGSGSALALLKRPDASMAFSARVGEMIDGWRVMRIGPDFMVIHGAGGDVTVHLRQAKGLPQPKLNDTAPPQATGAAGQ